MKSKAKTEDLLCKDVELNYLKPPTDAHSSCTSVFRNPIILLAGHARKHGRHVRTTATVSAVGQSSQPFLSVLVDHQWTSMAQNAGVSVLGANDAHIEVVQAKVTLGFQYVGTLCLIIELDCY